MYHFGDYFKKFSFHVEKEDLSAIYYITSGSDLLWCLIAELLRTRFKSLVPNGILASQYLNDHYGGTQKVIATKKVSLDPNLMTEIPI